MATRQSLGIDVSGSSVQAVPWFLRNGHFHASSKRLQQICIYQVILGIIKALTENKH